ncbi:YfiR family protein [Geofilum rubicundum]|uniref:Transmembrane protein n=1 Tax=Geofilum rubicundum JCM 15548 TaxID=1236989 RepID=A0A0E9LRU1_9BACT|nr:YfiR family protein [Geofilum rubicundum]GAO28317.1 hypothetical protein JCM15548_1396 [Geofilum rubicundum JCM 15548]
MKNLNILIFLFFLAFSASAFSQEESLKAFYTINLIRYVGWNGHSLEGDFVIAVVGNSEVAKQLRAYSDGKRFGHQNYLIKEYDELEKVNTCQVLYIGKNTKVSGGQRYLLEKARAVGSLIIAESDGMINKGAAVNFVLRNEGLQFELNESNAGYANLQFSSRLASMAAAIVLN